MARAMIPETHAAFFRDAVAKGKASDKHKLTFRIPEYLKKRMTEVSYQEGYGRMEKSRWISDVIQEFLDPNQGPNRIIQADDKREAIEGWKKIVVEVTLANERLSPDSATISEPLRRQLWRAAIDAALYGAQQEDPVYLEISIAHVIRAALTWRLGRAT